MVCPGDACLGHLLLEAPRDRALVRWVDDRSKAFPRWGKVPPKEADEGPHGARNR